MPLNELQQYEVLHGMAENAIKQTPHIRPDEWRAAAARVQKLAEQGRRLDGAPASAGIYGVGGGMTAAAVTVKKKPRTMEEFIAQLEREDTHGRDAKAEDTGEPAEDAGKAACEASGDGPREEAAGRDRKRRLSHRETGADAEGGGKPKRRKGAPPKLNEEQRAQVVREYLEEGKTCIQIAAERGVHWHTIERILKETKNERGETVTQCRERMRREQIIAQWRQGVAMREIAQEIGVTKSWVLKVISMHCEATGEKANPSENVGGVTPEERVAQLEQELEEYKALMRRAAETIGRILEAYGYAEEAERSPHEGGLDTAEGR